MEITLRPSHFDDFPFFEKFFEKITGNIRKDPSSVTSFHYAEAFLKLLQQQERMFFQGKKEKLIKKENELSNDQKIEQNVKNLALLSTTQKVNDLLLRMCLGMFENLVLFAIPKGKREIIGFIAVNRWKHEKETAELLITVDLDYRKRKIGKLLINHLKECARKEGIKKLACKIPKTNQPFLKFCESNNFEITSNQFGHLAFLNLIE